MYCTKVNGQAEASALTPHVHFGPRLTCWSLTSTKVIHVCSICVRCRIINEECTVCLVTIIHLMSKFNLKLQAPEGLKT